MLILPASRVAKETESNVIVHASPSFRRLIDDGHSVAVRLQRRRNEDSDDE